MSAGTMIRVRGTEAEETMPVEVLNETDLEARYDRLLALVLRLGSWLEGPQARLLPDDQLGAWFEHYVGELERLRELGDRLRPRSLRDRNEPLAGDALLGEVAELFAA